jgi:hypothetical protein
MNSDLIDILRTHQDNPKLGSTAKQALRFVEGATCKFLQTASLGQSSLAVVRMYEIRRSLQKFKPEAFIGLDESIEYLREHNVRVHLGVIETEKGVVSLWLAEKSNVPLGIVIAKFEV